MDREPKNKKEKRSASLFGKLSDKCRESYAKYEEKRARRDIIFTETITPVPPEKPPLLVRGGIDVQLLLTVVALLFFGAIMCFSASNVYASEEYNDSMYFFKRYILYATLSIAVTALIVAFAKPSHLRLAAVFLYGITVLLLLVVLVTGNVVLGCLADNLSQRLYYISIAYNYETTGSSDNVYIKKVADPEKQHD